MRRQIVVIDRAGRIEPYLMSELQARAPVSEHRVSVAEVLPAKLNGTDSAQWGA
jgi:hypothetical protein